MHSIPVVDELDESESVTPIVVEEPVLGSVVEEVEVEVVPLVSPVVEVVPLADESVPLPEGSVVLVVVLAEVVVAALVEPVSLVDASVAELAVVEVSSLEQAARARGSASAEESRLRVWLRIIGRASKIADTISPRENRQGRGAPAARRRGPVRP